MRKILFAVMAFAMSAVAADFTGTWSGEGLMNGESHPVYVVLKQDGASLTGTVGPNADEQHPFQSGTVDGDKAVFDFSPQGKGTIHFELKADGEKMTGTVEWRREDGKQSATVTLKKVTG